MKESGEVLLKRFVEENPVENPDLYCPFYDFLSFEMIRMKMFLCDSDEDMFYPNDKECEDYLNRFFISEIPDNVELLKAKDVVEDLKRTISMLKNWQIRIFYDCDYSPIGLIIPDIGYNIEYMDDYMLNFGYKRIANTERNDNYDLLYRYDRTLRYVYAVYVPYKDLL